MPPTGTTQRRGPTTPRLSTRSTPRRDLSSGGSQLGNSMLNQSVHSNATPLLSNTSSRPSRGSRQHTTTATAVSPPGRGASRRRHHPAPQPHSGQRPSSHHQLAPPVGTSSSAATGHHAPTVSSSSSQSRHAIGNRHTRSSTEVRSGSISKEGRLSLSQDPDRRFDLFTTMAKGVDDDEDDGVDGEDGAELFAEEMYDPSLRWFACRATQVRTPDIIPLKELSRAHSPTDAALLHIASPEEPFATRDTSIAVARVATLGGYLGHTDSAAAATPPTTTEPAGKGRSNKRLSLESTSLDLLDVPTDGPSEVFCVPQADYNAKGAAHYNGGSSDDSEDELAPVLQPSAAASGSVQPPPQQAVMVRMGDPGVYGLAKGVRFPKAGSSASGAATCGTRSCAVVVPTPSGRRECDRSIQTTDRRIFNRTEFEPTEEEIARRHQEQLLDVPPLPPVAAAAETKAPASPSGGGARRSKHGKRGSVLQGRRRSVAGSLPAPGGKVGARRTSMTSTAQATGGGGHKTASGGGESAPSPSAAGKAEPPPPPRRAGTPTSTPTPQQQPRPLVVVHSSGGSPAVAVADNSANSSVSSAANSPGAPSPPKKTPRSPDKGTRPLRSVRGSAGASSRQPGPSPTARLDGSNRTSSWTGGGSGDPADNFQWIDGIGNVPKRHPFYEQLRSTLPRPQPPSATVASAMNQGCSPPPVASDGGANVDPDLEGNGALSPLLTTHQPLVPSDEPELLLDAELTQHGESTAVDLDSGCHSDAALSFELPAPPSPQPPPMSADRRRCKSHRPPPMLTALAAGVAPSNPYEVAERHLPPLPYGVRREVVPLVVHEESTKPDVAEPGPAAMTTVVVVEDGMTSAADRRYNPWADVRFGYDRKALLPAASADGRPSSNHARRTMATRHTAQPVQPQSTGAAAAATVSSAATVIPTTVLVASVPRHHPNEPQDGEQLSPSPPRHHIRRQFLSPQQLYPDHHNRGEPDPTLPPRHPADLLELLPPGPASPKAHANTGRPSSMELEQRAAAKAARMQREHEFAQLFPDWVTNDDRLKAPPRPLPSGVRPGTSRGGR